jgi:hypothetical protein
MSSNERKLYYSQVEKHKNLSEEVAVLRVGPRDPWGNQDFRLAACSFALETRRKVIFHIEQNAKHTVPDEFQDLVVTFDSNSIRSNIRYFGDAAMNGDLVASLLLLETGASKAWVFEADVRLIGHWGVFLDEKEKNADYDSDLYLWKGQLIAGYRDQVRETSGWWVNPKHYHGSWSGPNVPRQKGEWTMAFGISQTFARNLVDLYMSGTYNENQEANMPTVADTMGLSSIVDDNEGLLAWECCDLGNGQQLYEEWMREPHSKFMNVSFMIHPVKMNHLP